LPSGRPTCTVAPLLSTWPAAVRRGLGLAAKLALVALLLYLLAHEGLFSLNATRRGFARYDLMAPAVLALLCATVLAAIRWRWLLGAHSIELNLGRALQLTLIGNFFSLALPGAVSGDFVKAFYAGREAQGRRADAFASVVFDRIAGVSALVIVSATALLVGGHSASLTRAGGATVRGFVTSSAAVVLAFYAYLFLVPGQRHPLLKLLHALEERAPRAASLRRIYVSLRHYHDRRPTVFAALMISIVIHLLVCFACLEFWRALEPSGGPALGAFIVVPLGLLVTAVPLAPAGVGTGHAAFGWLFLRLGSRAGANVFNLLVVIQLAQAAVGGLVYLAFRGTGEPEIVVASAADSSDS
jgi:glycosyltransferase 2 family protein